jgi:hypothetical protein
MDATIARRSVAAALLAVGFLLALVPALPAQEMLRVIGWVQWVGGTRMQVTTETGASVAVDLTEADQASYQGLRAGDAVVVDGFLSSDRRRFVARVIWQDSGRGYWTQSP